MSNNNKVSSHSGLARWAVLLALLLSPSLLHADSVYSPGGWATLHKDAGNRRSSEASVGGRDYQPQTALAGASVLTAPVASPDGTTIYVATGLGRGQSNLHAFTLEGELLWRAPAWTDADNGIDPCAILSSPIVDAAGDLYISDCNQLFAFHPDGSSKWVTPLPAPRDDDWQAAQGHPVNAFTTAAFTPTGQIIGVTNFGDVVVVDRASGHILNTPYRLPAEPSPYATKHAMPDSMLSDGLMDPAFREWAWQVIFAGNMRSANTPAVSRSGRVFVVGSSAAPGIGALYGLNIDTARQPYNIRAAFTTRIGIGSGSSPTLSPDERQVYVSDEEGWFYAIDSRSGEINWKKKTGAAAGAAAVGPDGTIYALQEPPAPGLIAIHPDGTTHWQSDVTPILADKPSHWLLGKPVTVANGNPSVAGDAALIPVMYGYRIPLTQLSIPFRSALIAFDLDSGRARGEIVQLADDSSGITALLPDGTLVNSLGSVMTSALSPLDTVVNWLLPEPLALVKPVGGIQISSPASAE